MFEIDSLGVLSIGNGHRFGEAFRSTRDGDQMNVIRQKAIRPELDARLGSVFFQEM
jgi:hypothetical protein